MKSRRVIPITNALLWSLLFVATVNAQDILRSSSFEGIIHVQFQSVDAFQLLELSVKQGKIRVDATYRESGFAYVLLDYNARKRYLVLPSRELYLEFALPDFRGDLRQAKIPVNFEKTGSTEVIAGYLCEQLKAKFDEGEIAIWATTEIGSPGTFYLVPGSVQIELEPWQKEILSFGYFPLKMVLDDGSGEQRVVFEATAIEKKSLGESRFLIPSGYEKTTVEELTPKAAPKKKKTR
ncbi:MAG TPA: hypothetical protein DEP53_15495 [Bacteroidetes bacterium]|nr:MAG: hypothetical protein A2X66_02000 [Ignavibacteria bacterium GWA2_54_16]HCA81134.1 hypothetical protein [Bacteroidota bacterium]